MKIRFGYELKYRMWDSVSMILTLHAQPNASQRLLTLDAMQVDPNVPVSFPALVRPVCNSDQSAEAA